MSRALPLLPARALRRAAQVGLSAEARGEVFAVVAAYPPPPPLPPLPPY